ncbi:MAG: glycosyltransferase family 39 protein [Clostridia bacterium]|nr:glycosyltransferase family 39 protein [Clostridia bacterium]
MKFAIRKAHYKYALFVVISLYFILNFVTIMTFPFVHSDETWLMGLSKTALEHKSFQVSEPFFDLYPRAIHGLRVVFISLQSLFISVFGFKIFSVRLLSLFFGTFSLAFIGMISKKITNSTFSLVLSSLFAVNLQFIMHTKVARQEAIIVTLLLISLYLYIKEKSTLWIGIPIGFAIGVHPNSFVIAMGMGLILLHDAFSKKNIKPLLQYVLTLTVFAAFFVTFSFILNSNFIHDYLAYGETQGITNFQFNRLEGFYYFYYKIYHRIGGTYFLVNSKLNLLAILITFVITTGQLVFYKLKKITPSTYLVMNYLLFIGINLSLMVIGRYNQTSIIFIIVSGFLLIGSFAYQFNKIGILSLIVLFTIQIPILFDTIDLEQSENYHKLEQAFEIIPKDAEVLGNLSYLEFLSLNHFHDFRNLWQLTGAESLEYLNTHSIEYIIWPEEMEYIHNMKVWEILYGPLDYYKVFKDYLDQQELIATYENSTYGMRIAKYVDTYPWTIKIYKITK